MKYYSIVNMILTWLCALVIPSLLLYNGLAIALDGTTFGLSFKYWRHTIIILGIATVTVKILELILLDRKDHESEWNDLKAQVVFITKHAKSAWAFGGGSACIVTGLFLFFPTNGALYSRFDTGFTIFLSIIAITLAIHVFYRRMAPIIGTRSLLESVVQDLQKHENTNAEIWMVYPALNIGFYRSYKNNRGIWNGTQHTNHPLEHVEKNLSACLMRGTRPAGVITYDKSYYRQLYACYHKQLKPEIQQNKKIDDIDDINIINGCTNQLKTL